jgi:hypothetical protein
MGCDYYIVKELKIYFLSMIPPQISIEVERENGYFHFYSDSDDPDYDQMETEYKKQILTPSMTPILLFDNGAFINERYEQKYKHVVENKLKHYNECNQDHKEWKHVQKICKVERRYERF